MQTNGLSNGYWIWFASKLGLKWSKLIGCLLIMIWVTLKHAMRSFEHCTQRES